MYLHDRIMQQHSKFHKGTTLIVLMNIHMITNLHIHEIANPKCIIISMK